MNNKKKNYVLRGKAYEPYLNEKERVAEWVDDRLEKLEKSHMNISAILNPKEDEDYIKYKKHARDYSEGYYNMLLAISDLVETIPFAMDLKFAMEEVMRGMDLLFPSSGDCKDCINSGEANRRLLETILLIEVPGDCTNYENTFFYTTDEGPFNRSITAFLGAFYSADMYLFALDNIFSKSLIGVGIKESFYGGVRALRDFYEYIMQEKDSFMLPAEAIEYVHTIRASKHGQLGTWTPFGFHRHNSPILRKYIKGEDAMHVNPDNCASLELIKGGIKTMMGRVMREDNDMTVDWRNGYLFFLSSLYNWIESEEETFGLRGEYITSLMIYFMGGLIELMEDYTYSRGKDKEGSTTILKIVSILTSAYAGDLVKKEEISALLDAKHLQCSVLTPQIAATIRLLYKSNALFLTHVEGLTDEKYLGLIENPVQRSKGFIDAILELGNDFLGVQGVVSDTTDKKFLSLVESFLVYIEKNSVID